MWGVYLMNKDMLFKEVDDCSICPFSCNNVELSGSEFSCNGDANMSVPCELMDVYGDYTLEEIVAYTNHQIYKEEEYYDAKIRKEREKIARNKEQARKRKEAYYRNIDLNVEIKEIRRRIVKRNGAISSLSSMISAMSFADSMLSGKSVKDVDDKTQNNPQIIQWKENNLKDEQRLAYLLEERKKRNKLYRDSQKKG